VVTGDLSSGIKQQGREDGQPISTSVEEKKIWIYESTLPYAFTA
jgi:hypothetical protein